MFHKRDKMTKVDTFLSADQLTTLLKDVENPNQLLQRGLTADEAIQRREQDACFNVVKPPIDCPAWACVLLPCIKHIPSMKAFSTIQPDDAEVLRDGKWIRYDAASLVRDDVIRMEEGDTVPADCVVVSKENDDEVLVDLRSITGDERLRTVTNDGSAATTLYYGGKVVQGSVTAVVTAIGPQTLLGKLIREKQFPVTEPVLEASEMRDLT